MKQGICPYCNSNELDYGDLIPDGNYIIYPTECGNCGYEFKETYRLDFVGNFNTDGSEYDGK